MRQGILARCAKRLPALLREVIQCAPLSGIPLADVEAELKERMQITSTEVKDAEFFQSWTKALPEVNDAHYVYEKTLYPCNWEETMWDVAVSMPREGMTEKRFVEQLIERQPHFLPNSVSLGEPVCRWVQRRFSQIIHVSRSAANGTPIYRAVEEALPPEAEGIFRALQLLGREKLPVYTNIGLIAPLLPASMNPGKGKWMSFLDREAVQRYFDVDIEALVRISPDRPPSTVFVDATSVEAAKIDDVLAAKGLSDSLCAIKVFRRPDGPVRSADDVVVQNFLDPEHAIGAAILSMGEKRSDVKVYILCGDAVKERYRMALGDLLKHAGKTIRICTPNSDGEASVK